MTTLPPTLMAQCRLDSPLGPLTAAATGRGLAGLWFDGQVHHPGPLAAPVHPDHPVLQATARALALYWAGQGDQVCLQAVVPGPLPQALPSPLQTASPPPLLAPMPAPSAPPQPAAQAGAAGNLHLQPALHPPLHLPLPLDLHGTDFQRAVWRALLAIAPGHTSSYRAIAQAVGRPAAVRAAGAAIGRNPVSVLVPCHRVLGARGALTGYAGGLPRKQALLAHEAALSASDTLAAPRAAGGGPGALPWPASPWSSSAPPTRTANPHPA